MLRWSVGELLAVIERAGLSPADLAAVHLAGGATRMPRIAELINERLGRPPTATADPKAAFATGALRAYARTARSAAVQPAGLHPAPPAAPADPRSRESARTTASTRSRSACAPA